ncbi:MAG TPA: polymer-forming cytoskeletal protein [Gemmatimonadaceae bacterium]|jgi:hypothetical protein
MRSLFALAALALGHFPALAQAPSTASPATPQAQTTDTSTLSTQIASQRAAGAKFLPDAGNFTFGNRTIAAGTVVDGPIAVARGDVDVYGTVDGDVVAIDGNVRVHHGARVTGDAFAAAGSVVIDGGTVDGRKRALAISRPVLPVSRRTAPLTTWEACKLVGGWFALLTIIGLGVMVFAEGNLDGVVVALERGFARSFWIGVAGQVVALPVLLALVLGLAITVIGVLLIPFAIVAYVIACAGLVTLGFLAVARLTGGALASERGTTSPRGLHLRALIFGLVVYLGLWLAAALLTWTPIAGAILRALAIAITWVVATVGLGATLRSRAGTKRGSVKGRPSGDDLSWQTPTPVSGVAAATRRVAAVK